MRLLPALLLCVATPAFAQSTHYSEYYQGDVLVAATYIYYPVTGTSLLEVQNGLGTGESGWWAYTNWNVNWTGECAVTVTTDITLPQLQADAVLTEAEFAEWNRMIVALEQHELGHVAMGVGFGQDMFDSGCTADVAAVQAKWSQAEADFDTSTNHGMNQGATLYLQ